MQHESAHIESTPDDAPTLREAMRVTHKALRAWLDRLKGRAELKAHLGMMEVDQRLRDLEPKVTRLGERTAARGQALDQQVREELSEIRRQLETIDEATRQETG